MTSVEVLESVTQSLSEVLGIEASEVNPGSSLVGDLEATSLDIVDLLFQFRKKFGVQLTLAEVLRELSGDGEAAGDDDEAQGFDDALFEKVTVQDVANWVSSRLPAT
jgi:acyl carrier protein